MQKKMYGYIVLASIIFFIDRISKYAALILWSDFSCVITSFLSCELHFNRGISWGLLHSDSNLIFLAVSLGIVFVTGIVCWYAYYQYYQGYSIIGQVCIIVGSLSNLIDRLFYQAVIDFFIVSFGKFSWPVFNIADMAIVLGACIMFLQHEKV